MTDTIDHIAICAYVFKPFAEHKCPGQIALGLADIGIQADIIALKKVELENYIAPFKLIQATNSDLTNSNFWKQQKVEAVLYYFAHPSHEKILRAIKQSGKYIIIKLDSDGKLFYPTHNISLPRFRANGPLKTLLRFIKWHIYPINKYFAHQIIRQLKLANAIIIESDQALKNLSDTLRYWGAEEILSQLHQIPNPITPDFITSNVPNNEHKKDSIVCVGRWEDISQKNTVVMMNVLKAFLIDHPKYLVTIIGSGKHLLNNLLKNFPPDSKKRVTIAGEIEHSQVKKHLLEAKIFFMPSQYEGLTIAGSEAVAMGCSMVGTPIAAAQYLANNGSSGTVAHNFSMQSLLKALCTDADKWQNGYYQARTIAMFWRDKLDRKKIAADIKALLLTRI